MSREGVALPGTGAPAQKYDRMNEAQYRAAVEQALARLSAAIREIEELSDDLTITGAWTFDPGPVVVGTDPGGSEIFRVGGAVRALSSGHILLTTDQQFTQGGVVKYVGTGPHGLEMFTGASDAFESALYYRTSPNRWGFEDAAAKSYLVVDIDDGHVLMPNLPTSDPTVADALWNDSGTLKVSSG